MSWILVKPVIDRSVRELCYRPYPNHPKGCPNWNRRPDCPPHAYFFDCAYDLSKPIYAVYNVFDFGAHTLKMKALHPNWSERQIQCCLYWQGKARAELKKAIEKFKELHPGFIICKTPEAMGVDITKTMGGVGIKLEWPPVKYTYQIALAVKLQEAFLMREEGKE